MRVLLIEFEAVHGELLYSHLLILSRSNQSIFLAVNQGIRQVIPTDLPLAKVVLFPEPNATWKKLELLTQLVRLIRREGIERVIVNTAHGMLVLNFALLCKLFCRRVTVIGVAHYVRKFQNSFTQRLINLLVRRYFVLNDLLLNSPYLRASKGVSIRSFYPIFFPFKTNDHRDQDAVLNVTIAGNIIQSRRDYLGLVHDLETFRGALGPQLRMIFLGDCTKYDGPEIASKVKRLDLPCEVVFFDSFIDEKTYFSWLEKTDVLLLLIDPNESSEAQDYLNHKISGTYNLSFGFKRPLVMASVFGQYADFRDTAFFYDLGGLIPLLIRLSKDKLQIRGKESALRQEVRFSLDYQMKTYIDFIS